MEERDCPQERILIVPLRTELRNDDTHRLMFSGIFPKKPDTAGKKALAQALGGAEDDEGDSSSSRGNKGGGKGSGLFDPSGLER